MLDPTKIDDCADTGKMAAKPTVTAARILVFMVDTLDWGSRERSTAGHADGARNAATKFGGIVKVADSGDLPVSRIDPAPPTPKQRARVNEFLEQARNGDASAARELMPIVYGELHGLAESRMRGERVESTLRPTALVHEAWLRLAGSGMAFENRAHFFGAAALAMRRVLVDHARHVAASPRGSTGERVTLGGLTGDELENERIFDVLVLNEALDRLEQIDPAKCAVVSMRFILGCTVEESALALQCSPAKVKKDWAFARAWLQKFLSESDSASA